MESFDFFKIFDEYLFVNKIDFTKICGVRKIFYGDDITEAVVLCNTDQRDNMLDIYEELSSIMNSRMCSHYYFGIHGGPIKNLYCACFLCLGLAQPKYCDD